MMPWLIPIFFLFLTERMSQQSLLKQLDALSKVTSSFVSHNLIFYTSKKRSLSLYICEKKQGGLLLRQRSNMEHPHKG